MRLRIGILVFAFVFSVGLCIFSNVYVENSMSAIIQKAEEMEKMLIKHDSKSASAASESLKEYMVKKSRILESLVPHEDLHDLSVQIEDIVLTIRIQDLDDCQKALALIKENADHLIRHEAFSCGNIF